VAHPQKIILFGSAAKGKMGPDSDLDFLVIVRAPARRREIAQAIYRNLSYVGSPVDVVVVTDEDVERYHDLIGYIIRPALREGKVVYAIKGGRGHSVAQRRDDKSLEEFEKRSRSGRRADGERVNKRLGH